MVMKRQKQRITCSMNDLDTLHSILLEIWKTERLALILKLLRKALSYAEVAYMEKQQELQEEKIQNAYGALLPPAQ